MILWSDRDLKIHACHPSPFVSQALHQEVGFIQSDAKITREMELHSYHFSSLEESLQVSTISELGPAQSPLSLGRIT